MTEINEITEIINKLPQEFLKVLTQKSPSILGAIIVLVIGWKLISTLIKIEKKALLKIDIDPLITNFLCSFTLWTLRVLLFLSIASMLGVQTTSFLAILGSAGLAIGLALQGSLSNLAGGLLILIIKPFRIGHFIEAHGHAGTVKNINLFHTQLNTPDNRVVMLPNGMLAGGSLVNYSAEPTRRIDYSVGISYGDDLKKAKQLLLTLAQGDSRIHKHPASECVVSALADSQVTIQLRVWVNSDLYWPVLFDLQEQSKLLYDQNEITIPFPQRDIHMYQHQN